MNRMKKLLMSLIMTITVAITTIGLSVMAFAEEETTAEVVEKAKTFPAWLLYTIIGVVAVIVIVILVVSIVGRHKKKNDK